MFPGFTVFGRFIGSYGICAVIGIFVGCPFAIHAYKKRTGDDISLIFVFLFAAIGTFVGMHLLFGITNIGQWGTLFDAENFRDLINRFVSIFGGSVFYGGLIGGLFAGGLSVKVQRLPKEDAYDCCTLAIPLFHGFARIGCFLGGCCYGVPWEHGITYTHSLVESANNVPRVPIQLFESAFNFLLAALLIFLFYKHRFRGKLLPLYLLIYPAGRFVLEFWRGDEYRGFIGALSTSQFISVILFAASAIYLIFKTFFTDNKPTVR